MGEYREAAEMPLLSVIVPVYNIMEYLPRCVRSLEQQTYRDLEILLVDDGSTDGTGALCDRLAREDGRIRVFHKENGGTSSARNLGIEKARGEFLGFVDSDDFVEPDMYMHLLQAAEGKENWLVQAGRDEVDEQGGQLPGICRIPEEREALVPRTLLARKAARGTRNFAKGPAMSPEEALRAVLTGLEIAGR